jgi:hypothetical protein
MPSALVYRALACRIVQPRLTATAATFAAARADSQPGRPALRKLANDRARIAATIAISILRMDR